MPKSEETLDTEQNANQDANNLELENQEGENQNDNQGDDPLDKLKDNPDELLKKAKGYRSGYQRLAKEKADTKKPEQPEVKPQETSDYVKRSDLVKRATREAREELPKEIVDVWDDLVAIPLGGFDPLDSKSIAKNVKERYKIYLERKPTEEKKADTTTITSSTVAQGTAKTAPASDKKEPPNFKMPAGPKDWYPKKS